jgi:hypothetical protein
VAQKNTISYRLKTLFSLVSTSMKRAKFNKAVNKGYKGIKARII